MPYKKTKKVYRKKRKMVRIRPKKGTVFSRQIGVPDRAYVKLKYIDTTYCGINLSTASFFDIVFNLNSIVRPAVTQAASINHIPDLQYWGGMYAQYRVLAVKITIEYLCTSANPIGVLMHCQNTYAPGAFITWTSIRNFEGNRYTKSSIISGQNGQNKARHSMYLKLPQLVGDPTEYKGSVSYSGGLAGSATDPSALLRMYVFAYNPAVDAPTTASVITNTRITYYTELYTRADIIAA